MAGHYRKKKVARRNSNWLGQLLLVSVIFVAGYMSASIYNLTNLSAWVSSHVLVKGSTQPMIALKPAALPKPKFEFYTLLANEQVAGSSTQAAAAAVQAPPAPTIAAAQPAKTLPLHAPLAPVPAVVASAGAAPVVSANKVPALAVNVKDARNAYLVQVASFRSMREAERMKVSLVMKGFDVKIAMVNQQRVNWYRVIIGPFGTKTQAQQAQLAFARSEHVMGMIRKMDA